MADKTWKAFERALAKQVGTTRIPVTGERHGADFRQPMFAYQAKLGYGFPAYLRTWLDQIRGKARDTGQIGVVVWRAKGMRNADALVCLRWDDWVALHGAPKVEE